ncbi:hypothetical protein [Tateyamaria sp.]|uniref:hypothetical protein n=1 Tax=Tateyamaria sp. TaxID=1929288 RepID=UPI00329C433C
MIHFIDDVSKIDPNGSLVILFSDEEDLFAIDKSIVKYALNLSAIGFVGKFGSELHDQIDDYFPIDSERNPITLLLNEVNGVTEYVAETLLSEPKTKVFIIDCPNEAKFRVDLGKYRAN